MRHAKTTRVLLTIMALVGLLIALFLFCDFNENTRESEEAEKIKIIFYTTVSDKASDRVEYNLFDVLMSFEPYVEYSIYFAAPLGKDDSRELQKEICLYNKNKELFFEYSKCANKANEKHLNFRCDDIYLSGANSNEERDSLMSCIDDETEWKVLSSDQEKMLEFNVEKRFPLLLINNRPYSGGLRKDDYKKGFCEQMEPAPEPCRFVNEPKEQKLFVITDRRCQKCEGLSFAITSMLKEYYENMKVTTLYYQNDDGKKLYDEISQHISLLPAFCFSTPIDEDEMFFWMQDHFVRVGKNYCLKDSLPQYDPRR